MGGFGEVGVDDRQLLDLTSAVLVLQLVTAAAPIGERADALPEPPPARRTRRESTPAGEYRQDGSTAQEQPKIITPSVGSELLTRRQARR